MEIQITHDDQNYRCDLSKPLDISIPLGHVKCFYAPDVQLTPFESGQFIGAVKSGAPVNFFNVTFNPHGNGTHTESLGHITLKQESINSCLKQFHFIAKVITVELTSKSNGDFVISADNIIDNLGDQIPKALIIRTSPNTPSKQLKDYSGTNPPYLSRKAMEVIVDHNVEHLLIDLPSVDREEDDGMLINHRLFWNVQDIHATEHSRHDCTITELVFISDEIEDGLYLINLQIPSLELDAAPSRPVIYKLY